MLANGTTTAHYELWVDASGLPVDMQFTEDTKNGTSSGDVSYSDWGTAVNVVVPPADQTVDLVKMLQSVGTAK